MNIDDKYVLETGTLSNGAKVRVIDYGAQMAAKRRKQNEGILEDGEIALVMAEHEQHESFDGILWECLTRIFLHQPLIVEDDEDVIENEVDHLLGI